MESTKKVILKENSINENWPRFGSRASDIITMKQYVFIGVDLLKSEAIKPFYNDWKNECVKRGIGKNIYIISFELRGCNVSTENSYLRILEAGQTSNYSSFFSRLKKSDSFILLTNDRERISQVIEASRETGIKMRVYRLDESGRLSSISQKKGNKREAFGMPRNISMVKKNNTYMEVVPTEGCHVVTKNYGVITLQYEFISNPQSITYQTDKPDIQVKIYQAEWLATTYFEDKVKLMLEHRVSCEGICWPLDLAMDKEGNFVGIVVPAASGYQLKQRLMSQQGLKDTFPDWNRRNLTHLVKVILDKIVYLQEMNVIFGLINPAAIFVEDDSHVYFVDMDAYQIEGYPILVHENIMQAPELQDEDGGIKLYTKQQDNYEIALLIFMILMPGKFPYNKGKNRRLSDSIKNKQFAFSYRNNNEEHKAKEHYGLWRFVWSHFGNDLKRAFYDTFQNGRPLSEPSDRRNANFWRKKIVDLEKELSDPYDKESLELFPRTFKRYSGTRTMRCKECGIEHPIFYFTYNDKEICNSCLGKPSEVHFTCRTCGKEFYYDYGTLFKYEKLVANKGYDMPTHCPYCRSDRKRCQCCNKIVPTYRIIKSGICKDCEEAQRNEIAEVYTGKCGHEILLTKGEVDFYLNKFGRLPVYCKQCRELRKRGY